MYFLCLLMAWSQIKSFWCLIVEHKRSDISHKMPLNSKKNFSCLFATIKATDSCCVVLCDRLKMKLHCSAWKGKANSKWIEWHWRLQKCYKINSFRAELACIVCRQQTQFYDNFVALICKMVQASVVEFEKHKSCFYCRRLRNRPPAWSDSLCLRFESTKKNNFLVCWHLC